MNGQEKQDWSRHDMWVKLLGHAYVYGTSTQKKKMKINYAEERGLKPFQITDYAETESLTLGNFQKAVASLKKAQIPQAFWSQPAQVVNGCVTMDVTFDYLQEIKKKEETPMRTHEQDQKSYLETRLYHTYNEKDSELANVFGLVDLYPKNAEETVKFIQEGKFTLRDRDREDSDFDFDDYSPFSGFIWRDPAVKKDREGYDAARAKLTKAKTAAMDRITVSSPEAGLKALQEFESATFH